MGRDPGICARRQPTPPPPTSPRRRRCPPTPPTLLSQLSLRLAREYQGGARRAPRGSRGPANCDSCHENEVSGDDGRRWSGQDQVLDVYSPCRSVVARIPLAEVATAV